MNQWDRMEKSYQKYENGDFTGRDVAKAGIKLWVWLLIFGLVVTGLGIAGKIVFFPAHVAEKAIESSGKVVDKTLDADNVIYNYEWFKQQKQDWQGIGVKIEQQQEALDSFIKSAGPRDKWTFEDKNESARLSSIVSGLQNQRTDIAKDYNAHSAMVNRSIFKEGVPDRLPLN